MLSDRLAAPEATQRHEIELSAAHAQLRVLDVTIAKIEGIHSQLGERISQVERQSSRNASTIETILARIDAFGLKYDGLSVQLRAVEDAVRASNTEIINRLRTEREDATISHIARLKEVEIITVKLTKILGLSTAIAVMLATLWRMASPTVSSFFGGSA